MFERKGRKKYVKLWVKGKGEVKALWRVSVLLALEIEEREL